MNIGDLVTTDRFDTTFHIGIVRKVDPQCASQLTVFVFWLKSGLVSWEDPSQLEAICE